MKTHANHLHISQRELPFRHLLDQLLVLVKPRLLQKQQFSENYHRLPVGSFCDVNLEGLD
jgi:hypothetical protein